jgi:threonine dehydrogenase-like Zn-dependent dehydrogenase
VLAGRIVERGRIALVEVEEPSLPASSAGEIIFQPEIGCLCGSDRPYFDSAGRSYPLEPGLSLHEIVGTVTATSGTRFRPGDRVLAVPIEHRGFFERFRLSEGRAIPIDPRVPLDVAVLAQPLGTVIHALKKLPPILDMDVAVVGQGPIGQIFSAVLRSLGANEVIAIEPVAARLQMGPRMGATAAIDPSREDPAAAVERITRGRMADLVIEAVGHEDQALDLCVRLARKGGRILFFGVPEEGIESARWRDLFFKNLTVHTSVDPDFSRDFPLAMRWLAEGRIDLAPLITHRFPLREAQKAHETFRDRTDGALKVLLRFPAAGA